MDGERSGLQRAERAQSREFLLCELDEPTGIRDGRHQPLGDDERFDQHDVRGGEGDVQPGCGFRGASGEPNERAIADDHLQRMSDADDGERHYFAGWWAICVHRDEPGGARQWGVV